MKSLTKEEANTQSVIPLLQHWGASSLVNISNPVSMPTEM